MLDYIKANLGHVITFIQEKYGELTKDEIDSVNGEPEKLFSLVENKFGVSRDEVESSINDKLANRAGAKDSLGMASSGLTDSIDGILKGKHEGTR